MVAKPLITVWYQAGSVLIIYEALQSSLSHAPSRDTGSEVLNKIQNFPDSSDAQPGLEILELNEHLPSPLQLSFSMTLCIGTKISGYCLWYKFFVTDLKLHSDIASSIKAEFSCWLQEELF